MRHSDKFPVPGDVALLYDFVNSVDQRRYVEQGVAHEPGDELETPPQLERWLQSRGLLKPGARVSPAEHREALELRTALRQFLSSSPTQLSAAAIDVERAAARFPLLVTASRKRSLDLRPLERRASSGLGAVLAELVRLSDSGRLERMKMCSSDECQWIFYDRSKPGNRRWCSSDRCGNREKTRAYRDRQRRGD
ncbi:CGNR zinc finger domain-containing protein [Bradyrhizobium sp. CB3481]|uniref:CGNR zinc finger domain-containing protein n=1 Tax=Bradyrhizobium sp. CB3481 TaxID=3039158 RepID=UPI0024B13CF0|nr:CGNR zinc finger domain-containing protein [Bradyrhizobium sp. CB3481]WFU16413.1 CGNR zinc finger domain-containing protein [Bradyrhizobium sp. CB3481]